MINLIPKEEKKKMAVGFYYRLAILFLMMFDFCILIALVSILPAYFFSSANNTIVDVKLGIQKNEPLPQFDQDTLAVIKDVNGKLDLIDKAEKNKFLISQKVIGAVILNKEPNIKIIQILYENDPVRGKKIDVVGIAPSREVLLSFRRILEGNPAFKSVDLPISNFVKGTNIQFNLSLIPA